MSLSTSPSESGSDESKPAASTHERLEAALDEMGELMVRTASGDELELHKHNVEFGDAPWVQVDADDETHWFNAESVERYWIHEEI